MSFCQGLLAVCLACVVSSVVFAASSVNVSSTVQPVSGTHTDTVQSIYAPGTKLILINQVSTKDLLKIQGVNPSRARAIEMYRKKYGNFKSPEELAKVKGFNKLHAEDLRSIIAQVSVQ